MDRGEEGEETPNITVRTLLHVIFRWTRANGNYWKYNKSPSKRNERVVPYATWAVLLRSAHWSGEKRTRHVRRQTAIAVIINFRAGDKNFTTEIVVRNGGDGTTVNSNLATYVYIYIYTLEDCITSAKQKKLI